MTTLLLVYAVEPLEQLLTPLPRCVFPVCGRCRVTGVVVRVCIWRGQSVRYTGDEHIVYMYVCQLCLGRSLPSASSRIHHPVIVIAPPPSPLKPLPAANQRAKPERTHGWARPTANGNRGWFIERVAPKCSLITLVSGEYLVCVYVALQDVQQKVAH